jgi:hypothetical protein
MADTKDPVRQLLDLALYAPVGLLLLAQRELPGLAAAGRTRIDNQITLARFIGKMAVTRGRQELQRRLDAAEEARRAGSRRPVDASSTEVVDDERSQPDDVADLDLPPADAATTLPEAILAAVAESPVLRDDTTDESDASLPIDGYDSLAASQVVVRLATLTNAELTRIRDHEASHRARRTILGKISQLQAR